MDFEFDKKIAIDTVNKEIDTLIKLRDNLSPVLTEVLEVMQKATGRIIITGMGKSGHIGRKIAASLASTGTPSFFVHPAEASHGDLGMITPKDVVIAISNSGEAKELVDIVNYCKRYGVPLIGMTKSPESSLGKAADYILLLPDNGEACPLGLAPTNSTTATLVMGDILTTDLMARRQFTAADFKARHPGGKLGSILQKVADLMHSGNNIPLVSENDFMDKALLEMTSKMLGCVGIVDKKGDLLGIITDGDLRRAMNMQLIFKSVQDIMTKSPKTITKDALVAEAVKKMNDNHITCLFVVEDKKPIGVIHIHDCLNAGVA